MIINESINSILFVNAKKMKEIEIDNSLTGI